ncbi:unnamed protein product, partial [Tilletia laevis]
QLSARSIARRRDEEDLVAAAEANAGNTTIEDEEEEVPTQASIVDKVFTDADKAAENEEKKAGRQQGSLQWNGPELRALLVAMFSHDVFDPTRTADQRSQSWLDAVKELNKWNELNPRKDG